jgi:hypothetical protein
MVVKAKIDPFLSGYPAIVSGSVFPPPVIYHNGSQTRKAEIPTMVAGNPVTRAEHCFALNVASALALPIAPPLPRTIKRGLVEDLDSWFPEIVATAIVPATVIHTSSFQLEELHFAYSPENAGTVFAETSFWHVHITLFGTPIYDFNIDGDTPPSIAALDAASDGSWTSPSTVGLIEHRRSKTLRKTRTITEDYDHVIIVPQLEFNEAFYRAAFGLAADIPMLFINSSEYPINTPVVLSPAGSIDHVTVREWFRSAIGEQYDNGSINPYNPATAEPVPEFSNTWFDEDFARPDSTVISDEFFGDLGSNFPVAVDMTMVCRACVAVDQASFNFMQGTNYGVITILSAPWE